MHIPIAPKRSTLKASARATNLFQRPCPMAVTLPPSPSLAQCSCRHARTLPSHTALLHQPCAHPFLHTHSSFTRHAHTHPLHQPESASTGAVGSGGGAPQPSSAGAAGDAWPAGRTPPNASFAAPPAPAHARTLSRHACFTCFTHFACMRMRPWGSIVGEQHDRRSLAPAHSGGYIGGQADEIS